MFLQRIGLLAIMVVPLSLLSSTSGHAETDRKAAAERFFRGIYACNSSAVDELASEDVVLSYPIFENLFGKLTIEGRDAAKAFAEGFCQRWTDAKITIHDAVEEGDKVVLIWSFRARNVGSADPSRAPTNEVHGWGGISLYYFDDEGKITAEIGEESAPGPMQRTGRAE